MLERFKEISLSEIADRYIGLRQQVIDAKLHSFANQQNNLLLNYPPSVDNMYFQSNYQAGGEEFWPQYLT